MRATNTDDFQPGDAVTITGGTFEGYTGTIDSERDGELIVFITIFGRHTPVAIRPELLRQKRPDDLDPQTFP